MTLKQTALYAQHLAQQARMVEFGGWSMPLHYGSQLEEHKKVRENAGIFDVSHMNIVDLTGNDAQAYLRYLLANDVAKLTTPGHALYSGMLNFQAGVIDDLIVYYFTPLHYRLVLNAARREVDLAWLHQQAANFDVQITPREDLAIIALQGPNAQTIAEKILPTPLREQVALLKPFHFLYDNHWMVARTGYTGEDGFEMLLPVSDAAECWQQLIIAGAQPVGLHLYGNDLDENTTLLESNLAWTIVWEPQDRHFIGREVLTQQKQKGVSRFFAGLILEKGGILRHGQKIFFNQREIGEITSGGFSPTLNCSIALARISHLPETQTCEVDLRGKLLPVKIVKPCFVRRGKNKILPFVQEAVM